MTIPGFVRQHVNGDGTPKKSYGSEFRAKLEASLEAHPRYCYQCSLCHQWHLTHIPVKPGSKRPFVPWYGDAS